VAKANNTVYGSPPRVDRERGRILWMAGQLRAGVVWATASTASIHQSFRRISLESAFGREGGVKAWGLPRCLTNAWQWRKTYKLYIGGAFRI